MGGSWQLAGYRVETLLGVGGSGEVWRATRRSTGAPVALKRVRLTDPERRRVAVAEAAVLRALEHPHLVGLHALEREDDAIVLVLDLAAGGSLHELLAARGRLTAGETVTTVTAVAGALAHAHAAGVAHGDVTPANVLFTDTGVPLLGDLGVARLLGDPKPVHTTLPYAAPEVVAGDLPAPASDVYMLGACALQSLTGHAPPSSVGAADPQEWTARLLALLARVEVPPLVATAVVRALALEPHRRGTSAELALDLRHAAPPEPVEVRIGRRRSEPSLRRLAALGAGVPVDAPVDSGASVEPDAPVGTSDPAAAQLVASWAPPSDRAVPGAPAAPPAPVPVRHAPRHASPVPRRGGAARDHRRDHRRDDRRETGRTAGQQEAVDRRRAARRTAALTVAAVLLVLAVSTAAIRRAGDRGSSDTAPVAGSTSIASAHPPQTHPSGGDLTLVAVGPLGPDAVLSELTALDRARALAFARRDPQLLARVYDSAGLLARDRAELTSLVPPGCGLLGVRTRFADVRMASSDATSATFAVSATLVGSRLRCGGHPSGDAPGAATARLQVELRRGPAGWRIAGQQPVRG